MRRTHASFDARARLRQRGRAALPASWSFRREIAWLQAAQWLVGVGALATAAWIPGTHHATWIGMLLVVAAAAFVAALRHWEQSVRRRFVREADLPGFLIDKLCAAHPGLKRRDAELVLHGLRQFFIAHLRSGKKFVAMPSRVVDTAWHEFILHTRAYQTWCATAFGGLLHHSPAEVLGRDGRRNDGLRRSWYWACKEEGIDPRNPARLPLLFALDRKFDIRGGFHYVPDCRAVDRHSDGGTHCGTSFGDGGSGAGGDADGFGGSDGSTGGGGSGCGGDGGCGGSGGD